VSHGNQYGSFYDHSLHTQQSEVYKTPKYSYDIEIGIKVERKKRIKKKESGTYRFKVRKNSLLQSGIRVQFNRLCSEVFYIPYRACCHRGSA
jgi:DNA-binding transcriptional regulator WhiA